MSTNYTTQQDMKEVARILVTGERWIVCRY